MIMSHMYIEKIRNSTETIALADLGKKLLNATNWTN